MLSPKSRVRPRMLEWRYLVATAVTLAALVTVPVSAPRACAVCIPVPEETAADRLIESDVVLLAREDPEKPFTYAAIEVLKGSYAGEPIDLFLNSTTRHRLAVDPKRSVVVARDGDGWRSLGYAGEAYERVVRHILTSAGTWQGAGIADRLEYFAALLDDEDRRIADLAYLEIGRAPYPMIKALGKRVERDYLHAVLGDVAYFEWRPLAILMLAQTGEEADRRRIEQAFERLQRYRVDTHLAAWSTAYVEIGGEEAIRRVEDLYFRDPAREDPELVAVRDALSVHGTDGDESLRARIVQAYEVLLDNHPSMLAHVASDLAGWEVWDLADRIREIAARDQSLDAQTLFAVGYYLGLASEAEADRHTRTTAADG